MTPDLQQPKGWNPCPHKILMTEGGDCNYSHSDCQYQILKWDGENIQKMLCGIPKMPKETECFGNGYSLEDDVCQMCKAAESCASNSSRPHPAPAATVGKYMEMACDPSEDYGIPTHPASSVCQDCKASRCCVIWSCPLRDQIAAAAEVKGQQEVFGPGG